MLDSVRSSTFPQCCVGKSGSEIRLSSWDSTHSSTAKSLLRGMPQFCHVAVALKSPAIMRLRGMGIASSCRRTLPSDPSADFSGSRMVPGALELLGL